MQDIGWKNKNCFVGKKAYSLDEVENKILRPLSLAKLKTGADIHFAINCASVSCPDLKKDIYSQNPLTVKALEKLLSKNVYESFKNPLHFQFKEKDDKKVLFVSSLFNLV